MTLKCINKFNIFKFLLVCDNSKQCKSWLFVYPFSIIVLNFADFNKYKLIVNRKK